MSKKRENFDILILGAGASGLMVASLLKNKKRVAIIEGNSKVGKKLSITGGGRCNISNANLKPSNFLGDESFSRVIFRRFNQHHLLKWLDSQKIELSLEKNEQFFCRSGAKSIVNLFEKSIKGINLFLNHKILSLKKQNDNFILSCDRRDFRAKNVIVATGGLSFGGLGATEIGFEIASSFGHQIQKLSPALVGFTLQKKQFFMKDLAGVSLPVEIKVAKKIFKDNLLFTHTGVSGPAVLNASLYWQKGEVEIDFLPNFALKNISGKKNISTLLPLPKRFSKAILNHLEIVDKPAYKISPDELERLKRLKSYQFSPAGTFGYNKAEVTKGGVSTQELETKNMMSKIEKNLFFVGEVVDITGELGGYNLQWAFSSAFVCAKYLNSKQD